MKIFASIGNGLSKALDYVVERNHRAALVNRLRVVIKNERENTARAYVALGKYYFDNLRDAENEETERLCRSVEESSGRMSRAFDKLDEINEAAEEEEESCFCEDCAEDCSRCPCGEEEEPEEEDEFAFLHLDGSEAGPSPAEELRSQRAAKRAEEAAAAILKEEPVLEEIPGEEDIPTVQAEEEEAAED